MSGSSPEDLERELRELDALLEQTKSELEETPTFLSDEDHPIFQRLRRGRGDDARLPEHIAMIVSAGTRALHRIERSYQNLPHVSDAARSEVYERLLTARSFIEDNFSKDIDLNAIARHASMSTFHFLRLFKIAFEQTPYQYLLTYRLARSADMLITTELPIYDIAYRTGFDSHIVYSTQFKQVYGIPPSRYRMMGGRQKEIASH
jgi:transcriptional regulator GlxA family with amidase domain